jgi:cytochrome c-type biogenesis protein CcmE
MFPAGSKVIRCEISSDQVAAVARKVGKNYEVVVANVSDDDKNQDVTIRLGGVEKQVSLKKLEIKKFTF